jgi:hypothetical protein
MKKPLLFLVGCVRVLVEDDYVSRSYRREFIRFGRSILKERGLLNDD